MSDTNWQRGHMSYQVIARKYRPQNFEEVIGQDHITKTLQNAIASKRIHHAYLFTGARGIGKTTVARILARALNCEKGPIAEPCGKCVSCTKIAQGASLDVQEIDGASNTGVDDVREIRDRTKYMPAGGRYNIYIIDEVHMLSTAAFNALLKTLEEPPPHVLFIFATTEAHKIPATILSRCQRYDFRRIPVSKITESLKKIAKDEDVAIDDESLALIAREATGSLRDAQSLFDQAIAFSGRTVSTDNIKAMLGFLDRKLLLDILDAIFAKDTKLALALLGEVFETGADLTRFAMDFLACLRHLLVIKECGLEKGLFDLPQDEIEILSRLASKSSSEELSQMFQIWYAAADGVARSPFPKMLLEVLLMRLARIEPVRPIADILEEIEALTAGPDTMDDGRGTKGVGRETRDEGRGTRDEAISQIPPIPPLAKGGVGGFSRDRSATPEKSSAPRNDSELPITNHQSPVASNESKWEEFLNWLVTNRPQIASIFRHGTFNGMSSDEITLSFDNPFYAEMVLEADRKLQIEELVGTFFKRKMRFVIKKGIDAQPARSESGDKNIAKNGAQIDKKGDEEKTIKPAHEANKPKSLLERKRALTKEALETQIVRDAAEILGAKIHDVRVDDDEGQ